MGTDCFEKYIQPMSIVDWIRISSKQQNNISICWKSVFKSFDLIGDGVVWKVCNGATIRIGFGL